MMEINLSETTLVMKTNLHDRSMMVLRATQSFVLYPPPHFNFSNGLTLRHHGGQPELNDTWARAVGSAVDVFELVPALLLVVVMVHPFRFVV